MNVDRQVAPGQLGCTEFLPSAVSRPLTLRVSLRLSLAFIAFCLQGLVAGNATASTIPVASDPELGPYQLIRPISAVVKHGGVESPAPESLYNGHGLTAVNPLRANHEDDPSSYWQHEFSADETVSVEFDLGAEFLVNEMWLWQLPGEELQDQGISEFDVVMRDADGQEVGVFEGDITQLKGVTSSSNRFNAFGECVFLPFDDCVRFVELRIKSNRGDLDLVGLAEVMFAGRYKVNAVPEPTGAVALLIGFIAMAIGRRRRLSP